MIFLFADHNYSCAPEISAETVKNLQQQIHNQTNQLNQSNARKRVFAAENQTLQSALEEIKKNISDEHYVNITNKASVIPRALFTRWGKKMKVEGKLAVPYDDAIREFSLTLHNISPASYRL